MSATDDLGVASEADKNVIAKEPEMESMSTSLPRDLAALVRARAEEEDRTIAVIIRRAVKKDMVDWKPGQE